MKRLRLHTTLTLVILMGLFLVACGGQSTPGDEAAPVAATESGELVIWSQYDLSNSEDRNSVAMNQRIKDFEAETGIKVVFEQIAWDQLSSKLALAVQAGGKVPDVVEVGSQHVPALISAGALAPLDDLMVGENWVNELTDGDRLACVIDGVRRCVAHNVRGGITYYKADQFPNGYPETAEAWLQEAARLKADGQYMSTFFAGRSYGAIEVAWWPFIRSNGGAIFDAEGKPAWATAEVAEVVEWAREMLANEHFPPVIVTGDFADAETAWMNGTSATFRGGSWSAIFVPGLQDAVDAGEVNVTGGVRFGGGNPYVFLVSEGWAIPTRAANPGAARAWLRGFMQPEFLAAWSEAQFGIPTTEAAYAAGQFDSAFYRQVDEILGAQGSYMQQSPYYVESLDALAIAWQELLLNPGMDVLPRLQRAQDDVLARYWE